MHSFTTAIILLFFFRSALEQFPLIKVNSLYVTGTAGGLTFNPGYVLDTLCYNTGQQIFTDVCF